MMLFCPTCVPSTCDVCMYMYPHMSLLQVIHRDIKPHNILLTVDGVAKLADFGCSRMMDPSKTSTQSVQGTVAYMSPEYACLLVYMC